MNSLGRLRSGRGLTVSGRLRSGRGLTVSGRLRSGRGLTVSGRLRSGRGRAPRCGCGGGTAGRSGGPSKSVTSVSSAEGRERPRPRMNSSSPPRNTSPTSPAISQLTQHPGEPLTRHSRFRNPDSLRRTGQARTIPRLGGHAKRRLGQQRPGQAAAARRTGAGKLAISVADQGPGLRFEQVAGGKQGGNLDRRAGRRPGGVDDHQPARPRPPGCSRARRLLRRELPRAAARP